MNKPWFDFRQSRQTPYPWLILCLMLSVSSLKGGVAAVAGYCI